MYFIKVVARDGLEFKKRKNRSFAIDSLRSIEPYNFNSGREFCCNMGDFISPVPFYGKFGLLITDSPWLRIAWLSIFHLYDNVKVIHSRNHTWNFESGPFLRLAIRSALLFWCWVVAAQLLVPYAIMRVNNQDPYAIPVFLSVY